MFTFVAFDHVNTAVCRPGTRLDLLGEAVPSELLPIAVIQVPTRYNRRFRACLRGPGPWAIRDCESFAEAVGFLEDRYVASRRIVCC